MWILVLISLHCLTTLAQNQIVFGNEDNTVSRCDVCDARRLGETWCAAAPSGEKAQYACVECRDCCTQFNNECCTQASYNRYTKIVAAKCLQDAIRLGDTSAADIPLGSFIATKSLLRDAKSRFQFILQQAIDAVVAADVKNKVKETVAFRAVVECPAGGAPWRQLKVDFDKTRIAFINNETSIYHGGLRIESEISALIKCKFGFGTGVCDEGFTGAVCFQQCHLARDVASYNYQGPMVLNLGLKFDPATRKLESFPQLAIWGDWTDIALTCQQDNLNTIRDAMKLVGVDFKEKIEAAITETFEESLQEYIKIPPPIEVYQGLWLEHYVDDMRFVDGDHILVSVRGSVSALLPDGTRYYHTNPANHPANIVGLHDWSEALADRTKFPLLAGARLTTDFMTAMANCTNALYVELTGSHSAFGSTVSYRVGVSAPRFQITPQGNISAVFGAGSAYARCDTEPNSNRELIDFNFADLNTTIGARYVNREEALVMARQRSTALALTDDGDVDEDLLNVGLVVSFQDLQFGNAKISLKEPPLPLETEVLQNAVTQVLDSQRDTINDELLNFPVKMPAVLQPYFPRPIVGAQHTNDGHGFISIESTCKCGVQQDGTTRANLVNFCQFQCDGTRKRSARQVELTERRAARLESDLQRQSIVAADAHRVQLAKSKRQSAEQTYLLLAYNNPNCRLDRRGMLVAAVQLKATGGQCASVPSMATAFDASLGSYYSLGVTTAGEAVVQFGCKPPAAGSTVCTDCMTTDAALKYGHCKSSSEQSQESYVLQPWTADACVGGNLWEVPRGDYVMALQLSWHPSAAMCPLPGPRDYRAQLASPDTLTSYGPKTLSSELSDCVNMNPTGRITSLSNFATASFDDRGFERLSTGCSRTIAGNFSQCVGCGRVFGALPLDQCSTPSTSVINIGGSVLGVPSFMPLKLSSCDFEDPLFVRDRVPLINDTMMMLNDTTSMELQGIDPGLILLAVLLPLCVILCCVGCACAWFKGFWSHLYSFFHNHYFTFGAPRAGKRYLFMFQAFGVVVGVIQTMVWIGQDAVNVVTETYFEEQLGVPDLYVQSLQYARRFTVWRNGGAIFLSVTLVGMIVMLIDGLITRHRKIDATIEGNPMYAGQKQSAEQEKAREDALKRKQRKRERKLGLSIRRYIWLALIFAHLGVTFIMPLFVGNGLTKTISVTPRDNDLISSLKVELETALNVAGATVVFNVIMDFFVNIWQLLPAGVMFGTVIFLADMGTNSALGDVTVISRGLWATATIVNVFFHFAAPIALCPAVIITIHRYNFTRASWLVYIWLILWAGQIICVFLAMYRKVTPGDPGQVRVSPQAYMFLYIAITFVCTLCLVAGDFAYADGGPLLTFFLFYRFTTFFLIVCYVRVWLEAYRPRYSLGIVKHHQKELEDHALQKEQEEIQEKIAKNSHRRRRGQNAAFLYFEDADGGAAELFEKEPSACGKVMNVVGSALGTVFKIIFIPIIGGAFGISYAIQRGRPATDSLPRRRTWLTYGCILALVMMIESTSHLANVNPKQDFKDWFKYNEDLVFGFRWPDDDKFGSILDPAFQLYHTLLWIKQIVLWLCIITLCVGLILDYYFQRVSQEALQRNLSRVQKCQFVVISFLFVFLLMPTTPDYLRVASLDEALPQCGEAFNSALRKLYGGIVGLVLTAITTKTVLPVLLVLLPSTLRGTRMIISAAFHHFHVDHEEEDTRCCFKWINFHPPIGPAPPAVVDHALLFYQLAALTSPLVIGIPMMFLYVYDGDLTLVVLYLLNWFMPMAVGTLLSPRYIEANYWISVWVFFFPSLIGVIVYELSKFDLLNIGALVDVVQTWGFWSFAIVAGAEICIANVVVADIVYVLIWSHYPDYSVLSGHGGPGGVENLQADFAAGNSDIMLTSQKSNSAHSTVNRSNADSRDISASHAARQDISQYSPDPDADVPGYSSEPQPGYSTSAGAPYTSATGFDDDVPPGGYSTTAPMY